MINRRKIWIWGLLVLIVINISALVTIGANTWMFKSPKKEWTEQSIMKHRSPLKGIMEKLQLNEVQEKSFNELRKAGRKVIRGNFAEMSEYRNQLNAELSSERLNMDKIREINARIVDTDLKIRLQAIEMHIKMRKILNADQLRIFTEEMKNHRRRVRKGSTVGFILY